MQLDRGYASYNIYTGINSILNKWMNLEQLSLEWCLLCYGQWGSTVTWLLGWAKETCWILWDVAPSINMHVQAIPWTNGEIWTGPFGNKLWISMRRFALKKRKLEIPSAQLGISFKSQCVNNRYEQMLKVLPQFRSVEPKAGNISTRTRTRTQHQNTQYSHKYWMTASSECQWFSLNSWDFEYHSLQIECYHLMNCLLIRNWLMWAI